MTKEKRYDNDYPSVTNVLSVLRKIGLEKWFQWNDGKWCEEKSRKGRKIGSSIHEAIHDYITIGQVKVSTQYGDEVTTALKSFMLFRKEHPEFKLKNSELKMTSEKHKCNGTLDCEAEKDKPLILDWKTGECKDKYDKPPIYDDYKYQVAAYVRFYNEVTNSSIEEAYILALAKDKVAYNLCPMGKEEITDCFNEVFLPALKILNYQRR